MKKVLMTGVAALTLCAGFTSCSHDENVPTQAEIDKAKYDVAFLNYVGGKIDKNQDWGFGGGTRAVTRAAEFGWEVSSDYEATFDAQYYKDVLEKLPEGINAGSQLTDYEFVSKGEFQFSIIYSQTSGEDKVGYYYYDPQTQTVDEKQEVVFVDNIQNLGNYVQVSYNGGSSWEDLGASYGSQVWTDWNATGSKAKVFTVNVPAGYRVGFFLQQGAFKAYSNSNLNNEYNGEKNYYSAVVEKDGNTYLAGFEDWDNQYGSSDKDCNDVIIAINAENISVPVDPDEPVVKEEEDEYDLRIIAEDLSASEATDFDFNDVVFDVKYGSPATIKILAAGGTLPLYINDQEVHGLLGAETTDMVNTNAGVTKPEKVVKLSVDVNSPEEANTNIVITVKKNGELQTLTATRGEPAAKLAVGTDFQWLDERQSIKGEYPAFLNWVEDAGFTSKWW